MSDRNMREAEPPCKVAAAERRLALHEAQDGLDLAGGTGHRMPPGWDREPLMALPKRRRKARKAPGGAA